LRFFIPAVQINPTFDICEEDESGKTNLSLPTPLPLSIELKVSPYLTNQRPTPTSRWQSHATQTPE
jgi:hypothetical protein